MAIRNFVVGPARGLRQAAASELPNLVVIAGPNGAGKSTLLDQIRRHSSEFAEPGTEVTYLGPHRPWRKATLGGAHLHQMPFTFRQYLGMQQLPGWDQVAPPGLQYIQAVGERTPESSDEAFSLVKFSIAKKGLGHLTLLRQVFDEQGGQVTHGSMPDVFAPLRELTHYLLPHLSFVGVEMSNDRDVRVNFRRVDGDLDTLIDIDELSSGEKAVVALFWPFIERRIDLTLLQQSIEVPMVLPTALLDEPDIHLHPTLQVSLLDYLRELAGRGEAQFILATHSPTMLDALTEDELYLLAPVASVGDANQFLRVSTSHERLEAMRAVTGSTHMLTRCRPIVYLEGEPPTGRQASDQRVVELLIPEAAAWVTVPASGKRQAIQAAEKLREASQESLPGMPVFALVDADQAQDADPDWVVSWPVAMIENLLLDADALWSFMAPHREHLDLKSPADVLRALEDIARQRRTEEIRLRVVTALRPLRIDLEPAIEPGLAATAFDKAKASLDQQFEQLGGVERLEELASTATIQVDQILADGRELEAFHGKAILRTFLDTSARPLAVSPRVFVYEVAQRACQSPRTERLTRSALDKVRYYVPASLVSVLSDAAAQLPEGSERARSEQCVVTARQARERWERGEPGTREDQERLRGEAIALAHLLRGHGLSDLAASVLSAAIEIGTT